MFGLLKKKLGEFIGKLTSKEEKKADEKNAEAPSSLQTSDVSIPQKSPSSKTPPSLDFGSSFLPSSEKPDETLRESPFPERSSEKHAPTTQTIPRKTDAAESVPLSGVFDSGKKPFPPGKVSLDKTDIFSTSEKKEEPKEIIPQPIQDLSSPISFESPPAAALPVSSVERVSRSASEVKTERKLEAKIGFLSRIKSVFTNEVSIQEKEILPLLDDLNLALLESDVSLDTAEHLTARLKERLVGQKIQKDQLNQKVKEAVRYVLSETLAGQTLDLATYIRSKEKPVKILFLGPNGAGKTTTIAKVAYQLKKEGLVSVLAAGDTFRAAAIEQLSHHGSKMGIKVVKHQYASDPAAVAFDAIAHAKTHHLDAVLIDTAGRQETNFNLLKEMEKINRVVKPDLKLFIGEAVAGHSLVDQAKAFHESLKLDGIVLTKLDCDAKGGTSFSLCHELKLPLVFLGVGQGYDDLRPFDANWLLDNVLAE